MSYLFNNQVELSNLDAFGRARSSEPMTIADYTHVYGENSDMLFKLNGSGTYSYRTHIDLSQYDITKRQDIIVKQIIN